MVNCPRCQSEMIWENDMDVGIEDEDDSRIESFYTCPKCRTEIAILWSDQ